MHTDKLNGCPHVCVYAYEGMHNDSTAGLYCIGSKAEVFWYVDTGRIILFYVYLCKSRDMCQIHWGWFKKNWG